MVNWAAATSADTPKLYRNFLKSFPNDKLATAARQRIGALELEATRRRLEIELGLSLVESDPNAEEMQLLQSRAEHAEMRAEAAEAAVRSAETMLRESRQQAETLSSQLAFAESRREQAEAAVAAAQKRILDEESPARHGRDSQSDVYAGAVKQDDIVRQPCPSCGNMINVAATLCGFCWHKLT